MVNGWNHTEARETYLPIEHSDISSQNNLSSLGKSLRLAFRDASSFAFITL